MEKLIKLSKKASILKGISYLLEWDQETYMPSGASQNRAEQVQLIHGMAHELKTSDAFRKALEEHIDLENGHVKSHVSEENKAALREWRRDFTQDTAVPREFVEKFSYLTSQAMEVWKEARKENSFLKFAPFLEQVVQMNIQKAEYLGYEDHPYDALIDLFEPGARAKDVDVVFSELQPELTKIIENRDRTIDDEILKGDYDEAKQIIASEHLLTLIGYDKKKGRLDLSTHPFSTAQHPTDSRITTRLYKDNAISNILTTLHEAGHALYEMGLPEEKFGTPLGEAVSLGVHESQSRFWETRIGLSLPFWKGYLPMLQETFPSLKKVTPEEVYRAVNKIEPSFIRVEADEATYPLHVILRFNLEKRLIEGSLKVRDLPDAWNQLMKDYLGITPPNNTLGCLQDVHWSMGAFGYFPTYALGTMYASQFFEAFEKEHPDWKKQVENRNFAFIREWLKENIHKHGRRYTANELLQKVTGKPFSPKPFIAYLKAKYSLRP